MGKRFPLSIRIVRAAVDRGINFLDNCWDYNEGRSEIRMGKALRDGYRDRGLSIGPSNTVSSLDSNSREVQS